jgi:hypothetical protein
MKQPGRRFAVAAADSLLDRLPCTFSTSERIGIVQEKSGRTAAELHVSAQFLPLGVGPNAWHLVSRDQLDSSRHPEGRP